MNHAIYVTEPVVAFGKSELCMYFRIFKSL